jgi:hypothetical protein
MITIHKYQFEIADKVVIEMPIGADILSVQIQNGKPTIWAKVETTYKEEKKVFRIYGTGHELDLFAMEGRYLATIQQGQFVWHIFD